MRIWVDADACPGAIREILYRAADRCRVEVILVANRPLRTPPSPHIRSLQVASGFDVADEAIVDALKTGDLVITSDIPLAAEAIERGAHALSPRGERFSPETVRQRLAMRDLMDELRGAGIHGGGPPPLHDRDKKAFADHLDRLLRQSAAGR